VQEALLADGDAVAVLVSVRVTVGSGGAELVGELDEFDEQPTKAAAAQPEMRTPTRTRPLPFEVIVGSSVHAQDGRSFGRTHSVSCKRRWRGEILTPASDHLGLLSIDLTPSGQNF